MSQFFAVSGQSIGASASASVLAMNIQGWFSLKLKINNFFLKRKKSKDDEMCPSGWMISKPPPTRCLSLSAPSSPRRCPHAFPKCFLSSLFTGVVWNLGTASPWKVGRSCVMVLKTPGHKGQILLLDRRGEGGGAQHGQNRHEGV